MRGQAVLEETPQAWHAMTSREVLELLETHPERGLADPEGAKRLRALGPNRLPRRRPPSWGQRLLHHAREFLVVLLTVAAVVSALAGERLDALAILAIVVLNVLLGAVQEARAERALEALGALVAPTAEVVRDGHPRTLPAELLVPGDLVRVAAGSRVPADLRLVEAHSLTVDEALLTGESGPVTKQADLVLPEETPVADRSNMVFLGTVVTGGRGVGVVVATGTRTELGRIAGALEGAPPKVTPLAVRLSALGSQLGVGALAVCALVFGVGTAQGRPALEMFLVAVSLAVAAIPEGLPAAVTVALALGVQRMAQEKAIVRRLAAVESLGTVTVVCTDKTGTLTRNELAVRWCDVAGGPVQVTGPGYEPRGEFLAEGKRVDPQAMPALRALLEAVLMGSDGGVVQEDGRWVPVGDPLEAALVAAALKAGLRRDVLQRERPRIGEIPFTPESKRTTTFHRTPEGGRVSYLKGAAEAIVPHCTARLGPAGEEPVGAAEREAVLARAAELAAEGLRVVAVARGEPGRDALVFLGLVGLEDPLRPEAPEAIAEARRAGVRPVILSGDHARTVLAVARQVGLDGRHELLTGSDLDRLDDDELLQVVDRCSLYARTTPDHKVRILSALQRRGQRVAMTGDGANDAPALARADVGIAMGRGGTDVAREAADLVLTDDNFATIVAAIREGRAIYDNIRKFVLYVLASNVGEVVTVLVGTLAHLPTVLTPIQILWINLVTDGLPSAALSVDPPDPGVMARPPRPPRQSLFAGGGVAWIAGYGLAIAAVSLGAALWGMARGLGPLGSRTLAFLTLSLSQLLFAFACRSPERPVLGRELVRNPALLGAVGLSVLLQVLVVTAPGLSEVFGAVPLGGGEWAAVAGLSGGPFAVAEVTKLLRRGVHGRGAEHDGIRGR